MSVNAAQAEPHFFRQRAPWIVVGVGLLLMYGPTLWELSHTIWNTDGQSQGPIVLALALWLLWRKWPAVLEAHVTSPTGAWLAWPLLAFGIFWYVLGRAFEFPIFEVGSVIPVLASIVLCLRGPRQLRMIWFPLLFMLFMVPLPAIIVDSITQPMKMAVSWFAEILLRTLGYPIARSGVVLQIGPYQLLVADACAGLHTLFTLEAIGLLYLNVVQHSSAFRNVLLAILIVPISFLANVIRVVVLSLITYHLGDAAGQGFLHGFAGMVLFISALLLIISADSLLRASAKFASRPGERNGTVS